MDCSISGCDCQISRSEPEKATRRGELGIYPPTIYIMFNSSLLLYSGNHTACNDPSDDLSLCLPGDNMLRN